MPDFAIALIFGIATALSRVPFVANRLWEWDSVLYARALEQGFHVDDVLAWSRPHPPGYVFYVASAAIGKALGLDSDHALVLVSVVASGAAAAALYLLCRRFADRALSALLTAAFAADPLLWLHGEVAMPYIVLAPITTSLAYGFLSARGGSRRRIAAVSFLFGALAGFRQDLLLFLFPLWLWTLAPAPWRARLAAALALGLGCVLWFVPSAALSDGPSEYVARTVRQFAGLAGVSGNAGRAIEINLVLVGGSLWWALLLLALPLAVLGLARAMASARGTAEPASPRGAATFFALWLTPPLLFYVLVHIGEWGFVLSLVPGCYVALAWLLQPLAASASARVRAAGALVIAANAVLGAALFVFGADPVFSAASLEAHDRATDAKTAFIRTALPRESTVVLAAAELLVARYYLPDRVVLYSDNSATVSYQYAVRTPATIAIYEPRAWPRGVSPDRVVTVADASTTIELASMPAGVLRLPGIDVDAGGR